MKVFFTCSTENIEKNFEVVSSIVEYIKSKGNIITYDWVGKAYQEINKEITSDIEQYYEKK